MTQHFDYDAERINAVKRTRKYVSVILLLVLTMLAYTMYQLIK